MSHLTSVSESVDLDLLFNKYLLQRIKLLFLVSVYFYFCFKGMCHKQDAINDLRRLYEEDKIYVCMNISICF